MKLKILSKDAKETGSLEMPEQFKEPVRRDLIKRAVLAIQANNRQQYGASPEAGKRYSAFVSKRRRDYKGTYGIGQSRTPRKILNRSGTRFYFVGAFAPQTVGGRRAHPPKASKVWEQKINETENRKSIRSALSSTVIKELVAERGHKVPAAYPFIISDDVQKITKSTDLKKALIALGFEEEMKRASIKKVRAGKGKTRGRKYKTKTSILFVVSEPCELQKSAKNFSGFDVTLPEALNAEILAPGAEPGRLTLYTESAIKKITDQKLFTKNFKGESTKKETPKKEAKKVAKKTIKKTATKKTTKKVAKKEDEQ